MLRLPGASWRAVAVLACIAIGGCAADGGERADLLLLGGTVLDGTGAEAVRADVAVAGDRVLFVGDAASEGITAADTVDVTGLVVAPGFIDMHSHAELDSDHGRDARAFLYQGITTVALGLDGGGGSDVAAHLGRWRDQGIGVNGLLFVGHNAARRATLGMEDRAPDADELDEMRGFVRQAMEEGAYGLSSGLFYLSLIHI